MAIGMIRNPLALRLYAAAVLAGIVGLNVFDRILDLSVMPRTPLDMFRRW